MEQDKKNSIELAKKGVDPISFFDENRDFVYLYKKTEKLAAAVYLVTNLFPENEPMKWRLRGKVSEFLSFMTAYKDVQESNKLDFSLNVKTMVLELISFLEVARIGGLISNMNFSILKQEFSNLVVALNNSNYLTESSSSDAISGAFFEIGKMEGFIKDKYSLKDNISESGGMLAKMSYLNKKDRYNFKRSNRQNIILNLLKKKKELTIKDIAEVIRDCSEKTIQRELISFISMGVLRRTGERRWSRYSLV